MPDVVISICVLLAAIFPTILLAGKVYTTNRSSLRSLRFLLLHSTLSYLIVVHFTQCGFPFNQSSFAPRKQRLIVSHVNRVFRDDLGVVQTRDSGLWVIPLDYTKVTHLRPHFGELEVTPPLPCTAEPYCGFPHLYPVANFLRFTDILYLPRTTHYQQPTTELRLVDKIGLNRTHVNITFEVLGPCHTHIFLMLDDPGVEVTRWSFDAATEPHPMQVPRPDHERHYFIYYSYGTKPQVPLRIWAVFKTRPGLLVEKAVVKVALSGFYTHGPNYVTPEMNTFMSRLPSFTVPVYWSSVYDRTTFSLKDGVRYVE